MFWTQNPQNFRAFGAIFLLFNYFLSRFTMFFAPETVVSALVFKKIAPAAQNFLFQPFCACVESAIAACKFENCLGSSCFMNNS